jgi:sporulation protein YlmC with PRC-barrel domain
MTSQNTIILSELIGKKVEDQNGTLLGRVHEVRVKNADVEALICGPLGLLQRMASYRTGTRIAWKRVKKVGRDIITIGDVEPTDRAK